MQMNLCGGLALTRPPYPVRGRLCGPPSPTGEGKKAPLPLGITTRQFYGSKSRGPSHPLLGGMLPMRGWSCSG